MEQPPLVSICIPAYNAERFIAETLESALRQDYPNLEIIVSDDCSTDGTTEIVRQHESHGVRLLQQKKNLGMHANWNAVIRASSGSYVCKLDADDLLERQYVSSMVAVMESHPKVTFAHCACRLIDVNGKFLGYERSVHSSFIRDGLEEWPRYVFGPRAVNIVMLRRSAFDAVGGYDERFAYTGDWKMHRDLLKVGDVFYNDNILASYRIHNIGKKGVLPLQAKENVLHLEDLEQNWPDMVQGKDRIMKRARRSLSIQLVKMASWATPSESEQLLKYLPLYGNFLSARALALIVRAGQSQFINSYSQIKQLLRQYLKNTIWFLKKSFQ